MKLTDPNNAAPGVLHLFSVGAATELKPDGGHFPFPAKVNGLDAHYYWRDSVIPGHYVHPTAKWEMDIGDDDLSVFVAAFGKMRDNGVPVPIVRDHKESADSTLGYIVDAKLDGGRLHLLQQYLGDDARDVGLRNHVSVGIDPDHRDGQGRKYGKSIVHSAATPRPVMPGQGEHILAASLTEPPKEQPKPDPVPPGERKEPMPQWNMTDENHDAMCKAIPGLADAPTADKPVRVLQHVQTQQAMLDKMHADDVADAATDGTDVKTMSLTDVHAKAQASRAELKRKAAEADQLRADAATAAQLKADNEKLAGEVKTFSLQAAEAKDALPNGREKANHARTADVVWKGVDAIDTATKTAIRKLLTLPDKSPALFAMTTVPTDNAPAEFEFALADILAKATPGIPTGGKTGVQVLERAAETAKAADDDEALRILSGKPKK